MGIACMVLQVSFAKYQKDKILACIIHQGLVKIMSIKNSIDPVKFAADLINTLLLHQEMKEPLIGWKNSYLRLGLDAAVIHLAQERTE